MWGVSWENVLACRLDLGQHRLVVGVTGPAPHPHRGPLAGDGQADDDLRQVVTVVPGLAITTELALALALVAVEVGGSGISAGQQVDLEVQQVRHGEEHALLHRAFGVGLFTPSETEPSPSPKCLVIDAANLRNPSTSGWPTRPRFVVTTLGPSAGLSSTPAGCSRPLPETDHWLPESQR
jgi:hypothetical protein